MDSMTTTTIRVLAPVAAHLSDSALRVSPDSGHTAIHFLWAACVQLCSEKNKKVNISVGCTCLFDICRTLTKSQPGSEG